jgi:anti-anti-sigma factor
MWRKKMSPHKIVVLRLPHHRIIRLFDIIDLDPIAVAELRKQLVEVASESMHSVLIINLERVTFLSSQTVNLLLYLNHTLQHRAERLKLCHVNPDAREVFKITKTDKFFEYFEDEEHAMANPGEIFECLSAEHEDSRG